MNDGKTSYEGLTLSYINDRFVFANKPPGMVTHRSSHDPKDLVCSMRATRELAGTKVYPVQRLDRGTSGLIGMGLSSEYAFELQKLLANPKTEKWYYALVVGKTPAEGTVEIPLKNENGTEQEAKTYFRTLSQSQFCSLIEARIFTGRRHQIRRHMARLNHHLIGDPRRGRTYANQYYRENFGLSRLFLHAHKLILASDPVLNVRAEVPQDLVRVLHSLVQKQHLTAEALSVITNPGLM